VADSLSSSGPLAGVRVLDLTDGLGELGPRHLADLGAEVIRVESPGGGGSWSLGPLAAGVSLRYLTHNANKRAIEVDLATDAGRDQFLALAATAAAAVAECELLASAASVLCGPEALTAVLDHAREASGMESVTLLERGPSISNATARTVGWTPVAVSGGPPIARPDDAAVAVLATGSLCLALGGRALPATGRRSLGAFAALAAAALGQQRLAAAAEAVRPIAEADRMRTALLATVSHDLRTPLAAAQAAVSCLRSGDIQLTAEDHDELLATADASLNQLAHLIGSLLDVSRLQAGALPVFPRPADLGEIIACSLDGFGPAARAVTVDFPPDLPQVMVDPPIMERIIVNLAGNALRYSPAGSPPVLTADARGDRVELRVIDRGPGIPEADRDRAFMPFQRLGDTGKTTGVGLGLTVSRGLTEAMGGTLEPEKTPGGGLTMTISLPAAADPRSGRHAAHSGGGSVAIVEPVPHSRTARWAGAHQVMSDWLAAARASATRDDLPMPGSPLARSAST